MRIRDVFAFSFALIALPGLACTVWLAHQSWQSMQQTQSATVAMIAINDAQRAQFAIALEFGTMGPTMLVADVNTAALTSLSTEAERLLTRSLDSARRANIDTAQIQALATDTASLRVRLYAAYRLPVAARDASLAGAAMAVRNGGAAALSGVSEVATRRIAVAAPGIIGLINIANTVSVLRDTVGRRNGMLVGWISGAPLTEEALSQADGLTGRATLAWETIQKAIQTIPDNSNLGRGLAAQRTGYAEGSELRWQKAMAFAHRAVHAGASQDWPETLAQFRQWATPAQGAILELRDIALDEGMSLSETELQNATYRFAAALSLALICLAFAGVSVFMVLRLLLMPLHTLIATIASIAGGDLGINVPSRTRRDELGELAGAIETLRTTSLERVALGAAQLQAQTAELDRARRVSDLLTRFEAESFEALGVVASAATELDSTAAGMRQTAEIGAGRAIAVAAASGQASQNVNTVAAATEELSASIAHVSRQMDGSADRAREAVQAMRGAESAVSSLSDTALRIGSVVKLISDIAGRTNLLALNATIEAARAGESGRGFAVVANEVKNLAGQTAKATDEIGQQIGRMQAETNDMVAVITAIAIMIDALNETSTMVSTVAAEQAQATQEIGIAVSEAARGTERATAEAEGVRNDAEQTDCAARDVQTASAELARRTEMLHHQMTGFLSDLRAA